MDGCYKLLRLALDIAFLLVGLSFIAACSDQPNPKTDEERAAISPPPLKPGQTLDPDSEYAKWWPGQPALFKFTDRVTLAIPPQFQEFWIQRDRVIRLPAPIEKARQVPILFG